MAKYSLHPLPLVEGKCPPSSMIINGHKVYYYPEQDPEYRDPEIRKEEKYTVEGKEEFYDYVTMCLKCGATFMAYNAKNACTRNYCPDCGERLTNL